MANRTVTSRRVLIVDGDPQLRRQLGSALRRYGYTVELATDGARALARLRCTLEPMLLLLDLALPALEADLLPAIERHPRWSGYPMVAMTAAPDSLLAYALTHGGVAVLPKPLALRRLIPALERAWLQASIYAPVPRAGDRSMST